MSADAVLLDTDVVVRHLRDPGSVAAGMASFARLCVGLPSLAELHFGVHRSTRPDWHLRQVARFMQAVELIVPDARTADFYGRVAAALAKGGRPIPINDVWIAALALQHDLPLWSFDAHFAHVAGLRLVTV